ncbi:MAG: MBL fold metallo-hydrolase, partial [Cellulomonadaceae bacterium]|nr:MBL fold metallo-hydrolase [Cellulomonadaceae bacterium]
SDVPRALTGADAVLVTHEHGDHVVPDVLVAALATDPSLHVWAPASVVALLVAAGAASAQVSAVRAGDRFDAAGLAVEVVGELHALIHQDVPRITNVGYLIGGVYHPGDAFTVPDGSVEVLLAPVGAPWLRLGEAIDFVRAVAPSVVVPIHDALLSDAGRQIADRLLTTLGGAGEYRRLVVGEGIDIV